MLLRGCKTVLLILAETRRFMGRKKSGPMRSGFFIIHERGLEKLRSVILDICKFFQGFKGFKSNP